MLPIRIKKKIEIMLYNLSFSMYVYVYEMKNEKLLQNKLTK